MLSLACYGSHREWIQIVERNLKMEIICYIFVQFKRTGRNANINKIHIILYYKYFRQYDILSVVTNRHHEYYTKFAYAYTHIPVENTEKIIYPFYVPLFTALRIT